MQHLPRENHPGAGLDIAFAFGNESRGLDSIDESLLNGMCLRGASSYRAAMPSAVFIPMAAGARSLNLGVCASIALYEATRQLRAAVRQGATGAVAIHH